MFNIEFVFYFCLLLDCLIFFEKICKYFMFSINLNANRCQAIHSCATLNYSLFLEYSPKYKKFLESRKILKSLEVLTCYSLNRC